MRTNSFHRSINEVIDALTGRSAIVDIAALLAFAVENDSFACHKGGKHLNWSIKCNRDGDRVSVSMHYYELTADYCIVEVLIATATDGYSVTIYE